MAGSRGGFTLRGEGAWPSPAVSVVPGCRNSCHNCPRRGSETKNQPEVRHGEPAAAPGSPGPGSRRVSLPGAQQRVTRSAPWGRPAEGESDGDVAGGRPCCRCCLPLSLGTLLPRAVTRTAAVPARCTKDRCGVLAGTQSGQELVTCPRRTDGRGAEAAPGV